ncbi:uncharacterized protein PHALS_14951 [Plasmopara halstedii]|uniref:Uncharacterized protein n=1 Tax=Plasmopara halstedii TaxID=4781 RepID=A0A0P1AYT5_PLAHL|nr:uncharacterized protein PHALS_14951 [Plasmopara halstedii]CEG47008.1 hypothetical protein PHALS_14951 [Plasmopara halstedii]|eukprot:XP_024583377.1 hypothetical protein PHALS_14951 [Plasmopara halstedii]
MFDLVDCFGSVETYEGAHVVFLRQSRYPVWVYEFLFLMDFEPVITVPRGTDQFQSLETSPSNYFQS